PTAWATPEPLIDAIAAAEELHSTDAVMSFELLSEKTPVALNCCVAPAPIEMVPGVTCNAVSVAAGVGVGLGDGVACGVGVGVGLGELLLDDAEPPPPPPQPTRIIPKTASVTAKSFALNFPPGNGPATGALIRFCMGESSRLTWACL